MYWPRSSRHIGHVSFCFSQSSMHSTWKMWLQFSRQIYSFFSMAPRQMGQASSVPSALLLRLLRPSSTSSTRSWWWRSLIMQMPHMMRAKTVKIPTQILNWQYKWQQLRTIMETLNALAALMPLVGSFRCTRQQISTMANMRKLMPVKAMIHLMWSRGSSEVMRYFLWTSMPRLNKCCRANAASRTLTPVLSSSWITSKTRQPAEQNRSVIIAQKQICLKSIVPLSKQYNQNSQERILHQPSPQTHPHCNQDLCAFRSQSPPSLLYADRPRYYMPILLQLPANICEVLTPQPVSKSPFVSVFLPPAVLLDKLGDVIISFAGSGVPHGLPLRLRVLDLLVVCCVVGFAITCSHDIVLIQFMVRIHTHYLCLLIPNQVAQTIITFDSLTTDQQSQSRTLAITYGGMGCGGFGDKLQLLFASQSEMEGEKPKVQFPKYIFRGDNHIRYLEKFLHENHKVNLKAMDLQGFDENAVKVNEFDSLHEKIYKKFARDGYLKKACEVVKKSKRSGDEDFYNSADPFIDDQEIIEGADKREPVYTDFRAHHCSLEQFYKTVYSEPEAPKRPRGDKLQMPESEKASIIKKVKKNQEDRQEEKEQPEREQEGG